MIRLIWKEMRERWVMHMVWAAGIITIMLIAYSKYFFGVSDYYEDVDPAYIILVLAAFTGGSAYASELSQNRVGFAFSRPIPWWKLMIAKLIPGLVVAVLSPIIAFTIFYLSINHDYHPYLISSNVIPGIWGIIWPNALVFTICFFSSSVLPGFASGFLTTIIIFMPLSGISYLIINGLKYYPKNDGIQLCMTGGAIAGFIAGGILLSKFFAKMDIPGRFLKLGIIVVIFYFAGITTGVFYGYYGPFKNIDIKPADSRLVDIPGTDFYFSPYGKYATVYNPINNIEHSIDVIDCNTGTTIKLISDEIRKQYLYHIWLSDDMIKISTANGKKNNYLPNEYLHQISRNITVLTDGSYNVENVSHDSKYILVQNRNIRLKEKIFNNEKIQPVELTILSFPEMKKVTTIKCDYMGKRAEWQDDNSLIYDDDEGKRQRLLLK